MTMDAATLYTIVTLANGRESTIREKFPSVAECEEARQRMSGIQIGGLPTRYSCERHLRFVSPVARTKD
jgi:hypothetical protein